MIPYHLFHERFVKIIESEMASGSASDIAAMLIDELNTHIGEAISGKKAELADLNSKIKTAWRDYDEKMKPIEESVSVKSREMFDGLYEFERACEERGKELQMELGRINKKIQAAKADLKTTKGVISDIKLTYKPVFDVVVGHIADIEQSLFRDIPHEEAVVLRKVRDILISIKNDLI